jgi:hypothetical protein
MLLCSAQKIEVTLIPTSDARTACNEHINHAQRLGPHLDQVSALSAQTG